MGPENGQDENDKKGEMTREERLARIKGLIQSQGEDAAKVLQMWLQQDQETKTSEGK